MLFEDNFLRLIVAVCFQENQYFNKCEFSYSFFQSIVYNNVIVAKQINFLTTFLKSFVHIFGNITGVVRVPQYY